MVRARCGRALVYFLIFSPSNIPLAESSEASASGTSHHANMKEGNKKPSSRLYEIRDVDSAESGLFPDGSSDSTTKKGLGMFARPTNTVPILVAGTRILVESPLLDGREQVLVLDMLLKPHEFPAEVGHLVRALQVYYIDAAAASPAVARGIEAGIQHVAKDIVCRVSGTL